MKVSELKFLLKLLGFSNYRAALSDLKLSDQTSALERERMCRELANRELVAYSAEIKKFKLEAPGKAVLKLDTAKLPITEPELQVLEACRNGPTTPAQTGLPAVDRQSTLKGLAERGLIKAIEEKIKEVWLTERGQIYLREEYNPTGTGEIGLNLLNNYLQLMRKTLPPASPGQMLDTGSIAAKGDPQLSDAAVLSLIQTLDRTLNTDNYLPIFHLREKLQPPLSRNDVDQVLYRLQRQDQIELSSLQEATTYTPAQIEAGIPQEIGGPLFFITVN